MLVHAAALDRHDRCEPFVLGSRLRVRQNLARSYDPLPFFVESVVVFGLGFGGDGCAAPIVRDMGIVDDLSKSVGVSVADGLDADDDRLVDGVHDVVFLGRLRGERFRDVDDGGRGLVLSRGVCGPECDAAFEAGLVQFVPRDSAFFASSSTRTERLAKALPRRLAAPRSFCPAPSQASQVHWRPCQ